MHPVHLCRGWSDITACGQNKVLRVIDTSAHWGEVTCGLCKRTHAYKKLLDDQAKEPEMTTEAVGIPTPETAADDRTPPLIHMSYASGDHQPYCNYISGTPATDNKGYATMDLSAVNCQWCLASMEFKVRNNHYTEMMSPTMPPEYTEPASSSLFDPDEEPPIEEDEPELSDEDQAFLAESREAGWSTWDRLYASKTEGRAKDHDAPFRSSAPNPQWTHDCEHCHYLGSWDRHDMYFCAQSNGESTVIDRFGDDGGDYVSGLWQAHRDPVLAIAVVRALSQGLLTSADISKL